MRRCIKNCLIFGIAFLLIGGCTSAIGIAAGGRSLAYSGDGPPRIPDLMSESFRYSGRLGEELERTAEWIETFMEETADWVETFVDDWADNMPFNP